MTTEEIRLELEVKADKILLDRSYIKDELDSDGTTLHLLNAEVIQELFGKLYTDEAEKPVWKRLMQVTPPLTLERYLLMTYCPRLFRHAILNTEGHIGFSLLDTWDKHYIYIIEGIMRQHLWSTTPEEQKLKYKKEFLDNAKLIGVPLFIKLAVNDPPEQRHIDDLRLRICYLNGLQYTFNEIFDNTYIRVTPSFLIAPTNDELNNRTIYDRKEFDVEDGLL